MKGKLANAVGSQYSRVQLKSDGARRHTGGEVCKVTVNLQKVLEVMSTSVYRGPSIPFPCVTVCHHISTGLYRSPSAQPLRKHGTFTACCSVKNSVFRPHIIFISVLLYYRNE